VRWEGQETTSYDDGALPGMARIANLVRSVTTPEFHGITFHEVHAKSALNHVPGAALPFNWTVNPYRGCSHACTYCAIGETAVLMADGRSKALAEIVAGDEIYGTVRDGAYRRYVTTRVLAQWSTLRRAHRVTLADGTELVTSGDHRFLTERGWKHVTGRMCGVDQRPCLTTRSTLMGLGRLPDPPKCSTEYRRGYLTGTIRGDGLPRSYSYQRPGRADGDVHQFRLALVDDEALVRTRAYLSEFGIEMRMFHFSDATERHRELVGIRTYARAQVDAIRELMRWPTGLDDDWCKGFMSGIFDAEGSCSGSLRISNTDDDIIRHICQAMARLRFSYRVEDAGLPNGLRCVRLLGGLVAQQRFFHTVDPAITRKRSIACVAVQTDALLNVVSIEDLGIELPMYDITTGTGDFIANGVISHNCFARPTHSYLDLDMGVDFDRQIVVKTNVVDVLRRELGRPSWARETVALGTNTDPYQRAEGRYRLMPGIIDALAGSGTPFSILTKGTLLRRDLDQLTAAAEQVKVGIGVSIALADEQIHTGLEPGAPTPRARLELVRAVRAAGLSCGVMVAPVLPWLTDSDEQLDELLGLLADAGATGATLLTLHLRPGTKEWFMRWLAREHPELVKKYEQLYGRGAYVPAIYSRAFEERVRPLLVKHGFDRGSRHRAHESAREREPRRTGVPVFEQQSLF